MGPRRGSTPRQTDWLSVAVWFWVEFEWAPKDKLWLLKICFKPPSVHFIYILRAWHVELHIHLIMFIVFVLNVCTMVSVASIINENGKGEMLCPNPTTIPSCVSLYTNAHTNISPIREPQLLYYKLRNHLTKFHPTLNPRPLARIPLSEPSSWSMPSPLAPV